MRGDLLLVNGAVRTMDPARPEAAAVAIRQGRVVAVGAERRSGRIGGVSPSANPAGRRCGAPRREP